MKIRTFKHHVNQGVKGIFKNSLMSLASIITVAACAFILIISLCLVINLDYILEQVETTIGISVFVGDELNDEQIESLKNDISKIEHVTEVKFMSQQDALDWAEENWGDDGMLAGLENDNPFPRSFELTLEGAKFQKGVINELENLQKAFEQKLIDSENAAETVSDNETQTESDSETQTVTEENQTNTDVLEIGSPEYEYKGIEKIRHAQRESEILVTINTALRIVSIVLILIMCIISIGIIMNTIKLTVFIRKNEINIMKYVGATDWFIRIPFIIEGIVIGLIGSIVPCALCWVSYDQIISVATEKFAVLQSLAQFKSGSEIFVIVVPVTLVIGSLLGAIGSFTSIRRHLNV